ncbi:MAG: isoleucine--tRNA ligase [Hyphomicrobiaceae bacterium]|jgi:isoleucyl-tRNA synthetase
MPKDNGSNTGPQGRDWSQTLFLPRTSFPMKAGLPELEPRIINRWNEIGLYRRLRQAAKGRKKFILHDGPPYANGHIHIGTGLNKILKDLVVRSQQMMGRDANYVPGWDCHGLPIEWKIEEEYRSKGKTKDSVPIIELRRDCRAFAEKWIDIQREEFKRLGVVGDWENPYSTMSFDAEAKIAGELIKFAMNGSLYRGSKPVMWSVVERTALAEAEVEYHEVTSPTIWVRFPVAEVQVTKRQLSQGLNEIANVSQAAIVIWTTTPWTIPGNRAIAYNRNIQYGLYEITDAPADNWAKVGERLIVADKLADSVRTAARINEWRRLGDVTEATLEAMICHHPFHGQGYEFQVRLFHGDHVTDDAGTGFVHTAPGHGSEDYAVFEEHREAFAEAGVPEVPHTVDEDGYYFRHVPLFGGENPKRVIDDKGKFGDANEAVIQELIKVGALIARGRLKHSYPHSWRSKAPVIFRNTPQWFIAIDKPIDVPGKKGKASIREYALKAIDETRFYPPTGQNRLRGMIEQRPDWVISRQRAWGVPITVFVNKTTQTYIPNRQWKGSKELTRRIIEAFKAEGADAWFADNAKERFLGGLVDDLNEWEQVRDILDVWFDSGSTHAFVLEERKDLAWPASLYLEGSDQHRGWFHSSLLESCGTRGRAPYEAVLTHGFVVDEDGRKMSKSLGNVVAPQDVIKQSGAEILRIWVASADYSEDLRIGPEILKSNIEAYRKIRNTLRWMLGNLAHFEEKLKVRPREMPSLDRYMLHRLAELDPLVRQGYETFDFKRVFHALSNFCVVDLSAFYFDIRKDTLYCEPYSSKKRHACLTVLNEIFNCLTIWLAPIICFTAEEAWLARYPSEDDSVHLQTFPKIPKAWRDETLARKWERIRRVRRVVTGALEVERAAKRIGSSLEAAPDIYVADDELLDALEDVDIAEVAITSAAQVVPSEPPVGAFTLPEVPRVGVVPRRAEGRKCARSWRIVPDVGSDPEYPDLSARDAAAVREFDKRNLAAQAAE